MIAFNLEIFIVFIIKALHDFHSVSMDILCLKVRKSRPYLHSCKCLLHSYMILSILSNKTYTVMFQVTN